VISAWQIRLDFAGQRILDSHTRGAFGELHAARAASSRAAGVINKNASRIGGIEDG
jgi:hypothetical protein